MADLASLNVKRNSLIEQISLSESAKQSAERAAARAQNNAQFATDPRARARFESQAQQALGEAQTQAAKISRLTGELAQVNAQIADIQSKQGAQVSSGQVVQQAQTARDDGASPTNPPPAAQVAPDGRVTPAQDRPPTNAQRQTPGRVDTGTNAATRKQSVTQSTPPITAAPGGARPSQGSPSPSPVAAQDRGAGASSDDSGNTPVRVRLNNLFGGINNRITPSPNVLDQYASYTYNISVYLMNPAQYKTLIRSKKKTVSGYQLLFMSGGAGPAGSVVPANQITSEDPVLAAQERIANLGRNEFFTLDYYIDDVQLKSVISGKGTGGAHNVTELKFKVIEPYGLTFLDNLFAATQQYIKVSGGDINKNYAAQNFLMVIRFYGYDDQGNLVQAGRTGQDAAGTDVNAIVEKFIPFQFTGIKFRIANKVVEYDCSAVCPQNNVNSGASRGVIPYNIELQSQTLKDLLTGTPKFAANNSEGRVVTAQTPAARPAAGARTPVNTEGLGMLSDIQGA